MIGRGSSLTYLADFVNGYAFTGTDLEGSATPVVRIQQLLDRDAEVDHTDLHVPKVEIDTGDLVFSWSATLATRIWDRGPAYLNQHLFRVDPRPGVDKRWLKYAIDVACDYLVGHMHGAAMTHVTRDMLRSVRLDVPQLAEQRAIADYLDAETARIDALIAKKQQLIHLLEERFSSAIEAAQSGWPQVPLKRLVRWREGPGIMAADFRDEGVPLIRVAGVGGVEVTLRGCNYLDPAIVTRRWSHFRLRRGDYLISASASMGVVSRVGPEAEGAVPYTGLIIFRPIGDTDMEFMRWFLQSPAFMRQIDQLKTGTAIQHFGPLHLEAVSCPAPPVEKQRGIGESLASLHYRVDAGTQALTRQLELLAEHRQALITAAVTGELAVPGAA